MAGIEIGKYLLDVRDFGDGPWVWIEKEDGEGMSIGIPHLEIVLDKLWNDEF